MTRCVMGVVALSGRHAELSGGWPDFRLFNHLSHPTTDPSPLPQHPGGDTHGYRASLQRKEKKKKEKKTHQSRKGCSMEPKVGMNHFSSIYIYIILQTWYNLIHRDYGKILPLNPVIDPLSRTPRQLSHIRKSAASSVATTGCIWPRICIDEPGSSFQGSSSMRGSSSCGGFLFSLFW